MRAIQSGEDLDRCSQFKAEAVRSLARPPPRAGEPNWPYRPASATLRAAVLKEDRAGSGAGCLGLVVILVIVPVAIAFAVVQYACAPTFDAGGPILNSYLHIDATGAIASTVSKNGLTPAELTFFAAGTVGPVMRFAGRACATVMCRKIEDIEIIAAQLQAESVDLVLWPSLVGDPPGTVHESGEDSSDLGYLRRTDVLAQRLDAFVVQSNRPHALNTPGSTYHGESKVYARRRRDPADAPARSTRRRRLRPRRARVSLDAAAGMTLSQQETHPWTATPSC